MPLGREGRVGGRKPNIITSLEFRSEEMEIINQRIQKKYKAIEEKEVRYEAICLTMPNMSSWLSARGPYLPRRASRSPAEGIKVGSCVRSPSILSLRRNSETRRER